MKEKFLKKSVLLLSFFAIIFAGCQSAQQLIEQGDTVKAIEKLAKDLTKKSTKQEDADLFVSVYPSEVEVRLARQTQTVSDVVADFVDSKGAYSIEGALDSVKAALSSGTYIGNEPSVRQALTRAESVWSNAEALYRIQKAVSPMPMEIGDPVKGEIYIVEKYYDDFAGQYSTASHDLAAFIYAIAEAGYPGETITQKQRGYDMYEKAAKYDSSILSYCNQREAELAFDIGSSLMSGNDISGKKDAINWFRKSDTKVYNYNGAKRMILRCNYEIGELYLAQFERTKSKSDLRNAISYFKDAGDYSDASSRRAYAEALLDELENPPAFVDEGTEIIDQAPVNRLRVSFGTLSYSDNDASAKVYVKVTGVDYLLSDRDFRISSVNRPGVISIGSVNKSRVTQDSVTSYPIIVENIRNSGDFTVSVLERDGTVVATSPAYTVEASKVYVAPSISSAGTEYSKTDSDVDLLFRVTGVKKTLSLSDIIVSSNTTGGRISGLELNKATGVYYVKLSDASSSGTVEFSVIGDNGAAITASDGKNKLSYNVSAGNIYVPVSVSFGRLSYPNATTATFSINVSGLTYLLGDGNFAKTTSGSIGSVAVKTSQTKAPTAKETVVYTGTVSGISGNGTVSVTVKDRNGNKIGSSSYSVNATVTQKSPVVSYSGITYPSSSSVVYLLFTIENPGKISSLPEVKVLSNSTGGTISGVVNGKDMAVKAPTITKVSDAKAPVSTAAKTLETKATVATDKAEYAAVLKGVTKDGTIMFEVLLNGKHVDVKSSAAVKAPQGLDYKVEYSKIYNPVQPKATFGAISYSTTSASATMSVSVTGIDYLLTDSSFDKSSKGVGSVSMKASTTAKPKTTDTVTYTFTANTLTPPCSLTLKVKDKNGSVFATKTYEFEESKIYKAPAPTPTPVKTPAVSAIGTLYSPTSSEVYLLFSVENAGKISALPDIKVLSNTAGGNIKAVISAQDAMKYAGAVKSLDLTATKKLVDSAEYAAVLSGAAKDGVVTFAVGVNGKVTEVKTSAAVKAAKVQGLEYKIESAKIYKPAQPKATFSAISYSTTSASAAVTVSVTGIDYLLTDSSFDKSSKGVGSVSMKASTTAKPKATDTVTYTFTANTLTPPCSLTLKVKDKNGSVFATKTYDFEESKIYKAPAPVVQTMTPTNVSYSSSKPEVYLDFYISNSKKVITKPNVTVVSNATGGTISSAILNETAKKSDISRLNYRITLTGVTSSGAIVVRVADDAGNYIKSTVPAAVSNAVRSHGSGGVSKASDDTAMAFNVNAASVYVEPKPQASFGSLVYSTTEASASVAINVSGLTYLLDDSYFAKNISGGIGKATVTTTTTSAPKATDTVRYTLTLSNITADGSVTVSVKNTKGGVIGTSQNYKVSKASVYVKPSITAGNVTYSTNAPEVYLAFKTEGVKKTIALSDITIGTNQTGGTISSIKSEGSGNYKAVLTKVTKSGNISFSVKGDDGKNITAKIVAINGIPATGPATTFTDKGVTVDKVAAAKTVSSISLPTDISFSVDASKVYVAPTPKATFGNLVYSTTEASATIAINVSGLTYLL
ncbi:MAG: hypothetical protein II716_05390, partial [Treponema sp.]|nr:hypothetical protein [Treponema sp.]